MWYLSSILLSLIVVALTAAYFWLKHSFTYWKRKKVAYIKPTLFVGNLKATLSFKKSFPENLQDIYNDPSMRNEPIVGFYLLNEPALLLRSTEVIKNVFIKDFNYFSDRFETCDPHGDPLGSYNLFFVKNPTWRNIRTKMTPVFTSGKLKQMYPLMTEIGIALEQYLDKQTHNTNSHEDTVLEVKELCALFTTDVIASVAFGVEAHSFINPNGDFRRNGRQMFNFTVMRAIEALLIFLKPSLVNMLKPKAFSKEFSHFLRSSIQHIMNERELSGIKRNDLIDILIDFKRENAADQSPNAFKLTQDYLVAQAAAFLTAGFETSSSTIAFALYELAKHQDFQQILRDEIHQELLAGNGEISYENLQKIEYLDMVVSETLRMYPSLSFLDRQYINPNSNYSLKPDHDFEIPYKMPIYVSSLAIQRDPQYWPNPNTFDPNRFSAANKRSHNAMAYLPFGAGPRNCIGMRLGLIQVKLGLVHTLRNHVVRTCEQTPMEIKFDRKSIVLSSEVGIFLRVVNDSKAKNM